MELFVHMYPWEWDQSEGTTCSDRVNAWLGLFEDCGFTAIAVTERLDYVWDGQGCTGTPFLMRQIDGCNDSILDRIQAHSGGFRVLLRQQTAIHKTIAGGVATVYGPDVFGPSIPGDNLRGLNPYEARSLDLLRAHAARLEDTIYDEVDWVEIGWTGSGECDDIRGFIRNLNTPTKAFRSNPEFVIRAGLQREPVTSPRDIRLDDAHMAMGKLWEAVLAVYGGSKPIGLLRGSCWHAQNVRRNLPFLPGETLAQVNDVNQVRNEWCSGAGFDAPYQNNALAFSCDILRGSGIGFVINEVDGMVVNFTNMEPPPLPHSVVGYDDVGDPLGFKTETGTRAVLCFSRGVSFMVTHFRYSNNERIPAAERNPPYLTNWAAQMNSIASHLGDTPLVPASSIAGDPTEIAQAIAAWENALGSPTASVPIQFPEAP